MDETEIFTEIGKFCGLMKINDRVKELMELMGNLDCISLKKETEKLRLDIMEDLVKINIALDLETDKCLERILDGIRELED